MGRAGGCITMTEDSHHCDMAASSTAAKYFPHRPASSRRQLQAQLSAVGIRLWSFQRFLSEPHDDAQSSETPPWQH